MLHAVITIAALLAAMFAEQHVLLLLSLRCSMAVTIFMVVQRTLGMLILGLVTCPWSSVSCHDYATRLNLELCRQCYQKSP